MASSFRIRYSRASKDYLKARGLYKRFDPEGNGAHPKGEDRLRGIVRKLDLIDREVDKLPNYKGETERDKQAREDHFRQSLGEIEASLMDHFRLVRNAAVHADIGKSADCFYDDYVLPHANRIERHYKVKPAHPSEITVHDMILHSKIMQKVVATLCARARPDIRAEVLPHLLKRFSRFESATRRRNAIIGTLRTEYLLDLEVARGYALEVIKAD